MAPKIPEDFPVDRSSVSRTEKCLQKRCVYEEFQRVRCLPDVGVCLTAVTALAQQAAVNLGSDSTFAVLGGTTVTVTGGGTITGNAGIFPGTAYVAGTPAVTVNGTVYAGGPVAAQAQADLTTA